MDNNKDKKEIEIEGEETLDKRNDDGDNIYPLKLNDIRIDRDRMSLEEIKRQYKEKKRLILDPDFQRNDVWKKPKQKSELIESILMGIPLPIIYVFQTEDAKRQVIDGRQRIATIVSFMNDEFKLAQLKIIKDISGKKFSDLESIQQRKIEDYQMDIYVIKPPTPERVKIDIFDRVNRGGTILNNQEMRNALYQGQATELLRELSGNENFKNATGHSVKSERMKDRYIILRFLGFYLHFTQQLDGVEYGGNIDDFLTKVMQYLNKADEKLIAELKNLFDKTMKFAYKNFGDDVFRFSNKNHSKKRPINMALFECLSFAFALCVQNNTKIDEKALNNLKIEFDESDKFTSGLDSLPNINYRFDEAKKLII